MLERVIRAQTVGPVAQGEPPRDAPARRLPDPWAPPGREAGGVLASARRRELGGGPMSSPLVVGIAGGTASGKTTVTRKIHEALTDSRVAFIDQDAYYRDLSEMNLE